MVVFCYMRRGLTLWPLFVILITATIYELAYFGNIYLTYLLLENSIPELTLLPSSVTDTKMPQFLRYCLVLEPFLV